MTDEQKQQIIALRRGGVWQDSGTAWWRKRRHQSV